MIIVFFLFKSDFSPHVYISLYVYTYLDRYAYVYIHTYVYVYIQFVHIVQI